MRHGYTMTLSLLHTAVNSLASASMKMTEESASCLRDATFFDWDLLRRCSWWPAPRAPQPLAIFGPTKTSLPPQVITIYDSFYSPTQRELARGATPKPALSDVALLWKEMVKAYGSEELALRAAARTSS